MVYVRSWLYPFLAYLVYYLCYIFLNLVFCIVSITGVKGRNCCLKLFLGCCLQCLVLPRINNHGVRSFSQESPTIRATHSRAVITRAVVELPVVTGEVMGGSPWGSGRLEPLQRRVGDTHSLREASSRLPARVREPGRRRRICAQARRVFTTTPPPLASHHVRADRL